MVARFENTIQPKTLQKLHWYAKIIASEFFEVCFVVLPITANASDWNLTPEKICVLVHV